MTEFSLAVGTAGLFLYYKNDNKNWRTQLLGSLQFKYLVSDNRLYATRNPVPFIIYGARFPVYTFCNRVNEYESNLQESDTIICLPGDEGSEFHEKSFTIKNCPVPITLEIVYKE